MTLPLGGANLYYRHSGRIDAARFGPALLGALATATVTAVLYAYIICYIPIGGAITFLLTIGCAIAVGFVAGRLLRWAKVRNLPLTAGLIVLLTLWTLYVSWVVYCFALVQRADHQVPISALWELIAEPKSLANLIMLINQEGAWSLKSLHPTGVVLWALWLFEAVLLLGTIWYIVWNMLRDQPFCEQCQKWGQTRSIVQTNPGKILAIRGMIERKEFDCMEKLGLLQGNTHWFEFCLQGCADCDTTQTLSIWERILTVDNKGKATINTKPVVRQLWLSPEETVALATMAAKLQMPPLPELTTQMPIVSTEPKPT